MPALMISYYKSVNYSLLEGMPTLWMIGDLRHHGLCIIIMSGKALFRMSVD